MKNYSFKTFCLVVCSAVVIFIFFQTNVEYLAAASNIFYTRQNVNKNYAFFDSYSRIKLYNNSLETNPNKTNRYLFATFTKPTENSKLVISDVGSYGVGFGNLIYHVIDSLIVSLITDRISLINYNLWFIDLPVVLDSNVYLPNAADIDYGRAQSWRYPKNATILMQTTIRNHENILWTSAPKPHFFEICSNPIYFQKLLDMNANSN
jgi:hypothetical protein